MASCATVQPEVTEEVPPPAPVDPENTYSYWDEAPGATGRIRVTINLTEQTAYIYRGKKMVGRSRVATGKRSHRTPAGSFYIMEKTADKRSNLYGVILDSAGNVIISDADSRKHSPPKGGKFLGASMPYWMRLTSRGVGMHHGPIPNPGSPASHGCIRMPSHMAQKLFTRAPIGTPVKIVY